MKVSEAEAEREFRRRNEQVKAEYVQVDAAPLPGGVRAHRGRGEGPLRGETDAYRLPEKRVVSYVLLDAEALKPRVTVTDGELEAYYQAHSEEFKQEEQACASHILVKVKAAPEATEGHPDAEARALAQGLLDQVKGGADFAALAKKSSEDQGSAANGGDLGCFARGRMVPAVRRRRLRDAGRPDLRPRALEPRLPHHQAGLDPRGERSDALAR